MNNSKKNYYLNSGCLGPVAKLLPQQASWLAVMRQQLLPQFPPLSFDLFYRRSVLTLRPDHLVESALFWGQRVLCQGPTATYTKNKPIASLGSAGSHLVIGICLLLQAVFLCLNPPYNTGVGPLPSLFRGSGRLQLSLQLSLQLTPGEACLVSPFSF